MNTVHKDDDGFKFVDLFAGMGGFHQAMRYLGGKCILASELDEECRAIYHINFKNTPEAGDIRECEPPVESYSVLCAGFPCQPFSKAGLQRGFNDKGRGDLFYQVMRFVEAQPDLKFIILENVRNLADKKENWNIIVSSIKNAGFIVTEDPLILSPTDFGIPQYRERVFILAIRADIADKSKLPEGKITIECLNIQSRFRKCKSEQAFSILNKYDSAELEPYRVNDEIVEVIEAWEEFRKNTFICKLGAPVWIQAFGVGIDSDSNFKVMTGYHHMPCWKQKFYDKNRRLYNNYRDFIDQWIERYHMLDRIKLYQKFEWNCGDDDRSIRDTIIQVRQSGIRCKRPDYFPSLVAITNTPIVWDKNVGFYRYITPREAAKLQSFHGRYKLEGDDKTLYRQLGNSVNVRILKILGRGLFNLEKRHERDNN